MEGRAKADLPKVRATPLFDSGQQGFKELDKAQAEHDDELTHLLSMFADDGRVIVQRRGESCMI
jgi:hypothetical protein